MTSSSTWQIIKARGASAPWLIIIAILLTSHGWFSYDHSVVWQKAFYLRSLALPLALALTVGAFPGAAPYNPDDSKDYWKVSSITFKLFLMVHVFVLLLFKLNSQS